MAYYFSTQINEPFEQAVDQVIEALQEQGFGIISRIDVQDTFKRKLDIDFRPYLILGACNPGLAHEALQLEDKVGTMLPCNVVVQQTEQGAEVAAIDPVASMQAIENPQLGERAALVADKLRRAIESLSDGS